MRKKFDFANTARAQLDIVPRQIVRIVLRPHAQRPLDVVNLRQSVKVGRPPPDERADFFQKRPARLFVTRHGARFDERRAFPVLGKAFVITSGGFRAKRNRRRTGIGAQAQIRAENIALRRLLLHHRDQSAGQLDKERADVALARIGRVFRIVQGNQVDVRRIVQFPRAQFAHRQNNQSAVFFGIFGI